MWAEDYAPSQQAGAFVRLGVSMSIRVTDDTPQAELEECLAHLCHAAKRCVPKVGDAEHPTGWDRCHLRIDAMLDDWLRVRASTR